MDTVDYLRHRMVIRAAERARWRHFAAGVVVAMLVTFTLAVAAFAQVPDGANRYKRDLIRFWRAEWGIQAPTAAAAAQVHQESAWRADARSWVGPPGLTQFMPRTADWMIEVFGDRIGTEGPLDPRWALRAQAAYMRHLFDQIDALDRCEQFAFALSAYNGGLGWVLRRKARSAVPDICLGATCRINPGIAASNQTENERYSERILLVLQPRYFQAGWGPGVCHT